MTTLGEELKNLNQASSYRPVANFEALPLSGAGRWSHLYGGITLYTNDANVLFVKAAESTIEFSRLIQGIRKAYKAGQSAAEAFDHLRQGYEVVSGDLSELG